MYLGEGKMGREPNCTWTGRMLSKAIENMLVRTCKSTENLGQKGKEYLYCSHQVCDIELGILNWISIQIILILMPMVFLTLLYSLLQKMIS